VVLVAVAVQEQQPEVLRVALEPQGKETMVEPGGVLVLAIVIMLAGVEENQQ
jgi:hypothetical protein